MDLSNTFFLTILIWVRLPGLPLEFWHEDIFRGIVGSFRDIIVMDQATALKSKLQNARLYVKVENLNHLLGKVELTSKLGKRMQEVIYEDLPNTCFAYKKQGHWVKNCPTKGKSTSKTKNEDKKKEVKVQRKVWKPKVNHAKDMKDKLNSDFSKIQ